MRWVAIGKPTWTVVALPCSAVALGGLVIAGCGSARVPGNKPAGAVHGPPVPASAIPSLRAIADRAAKVNGGAVPSWISAVVTTYRKALTSATPGDIVAGAGSAAVHLVTMKGRFRSPMGPAPLPGHRPHAPMGDYLSLVVNAKTRAGSGAARPACPPGPARPAPAAPACSAGGTCLPRRLALAPGGGRRLVGGRQFVEAALVGLHDGGQLVDLVLHGGQDSPSGRWG